MKRLAAVVAFVIAATAAAAAAPGASLDGLLRAHDWLNGSVTLASLRGKVVLLDFYTFDCINCKHVQPNLRTLYHGTARQDLAIVSVHSPETPYEHDRHNLIDSLKAQGVAWPVAVDNDFAIWNSYGVEAWPTQLVFDRHGVLRATIVGEGQDAELDATIDKLIAQR